MHQVLGQLCRLGWQYVYWINRRGKKLIKNKLTDDEEPYGYSKRPCSDPLSSWRMSLLAMLGVPSLRKTHYRNNQQSETKDKIEKAFIQVYTSILHYSARVEKQQKVNSGEKAAAECFCSVLSPNHTNWVSHQKWWANPTPLGPGEWASSAPKECRRHARAN